jgi:hypothetical protein
MMRKKRRDEIVREESFTWHDIGSGWKEGVSTIIFSVVAYGLIL